MLEMSFYDGTLNREKAIDFIANSAKPCVYTYGLKYRKPTTYEVNITKEQAINCIRNESLIDIKEYEDKIDINAYSSNDMW